MIQADGGTRTAAITGACVALRIAVNRLLKAGAIQRDPLAAPVSAVSVGIYAGQPVLDLDYPEDSEAGVDANVVMAGDRRPHRGADVGRGRDLHPGADGHADRPGPAMGNARLAEAQLAAVSAA